jgi:hypothetical protein
VEAKANEWRQVGYPQAIAQLEKEFGVTEEEVGVDSSFNLEEIREAFQWLTAHNKQERRKAEENTAKQAEKEKLRKKAKGTISEPIIVKPTWRRGTPEDEIQFRKVMKEIQQKHGRHKTLGYYSGWTEKKLWSFFDAQAEEEKARREKEKARQEEEKAKEKREKRQEAATRKMEERILARKEKDALTQETNNALEAIETRSGKDRERYWKLKNDLEQGANNEIFSAKIREALQADLDKLIETEGQKWGDPAAS